MTSSREEILAAALEAIERGASVESIVARDPDAAELRGLIESAAQARRLRPEVVPPAAIRRSRARALARAAALAQTAPARAPAFVMRFALAGLAVLLLIGITGAGLTNAAADSLPGDALYRVKLAAERLRLRFAAAPESRLELEDLYAEQRIDEVVALLALGRTVPISFVGEVRAIGPVLWDVAGVTVRRTPDTIILGEILPGMEIEIEGITQTDGTVLAHEIHLHAYDTIGLLEALEAGQATISGASFARTAESWIEAGVEVGDRVLARIAMDDAGGRRIISLLRFAPPSPTAAPTASPAPPSPPTATPEPQASATDDDTPEPDESETPDPEKTEEGDDGPDSGDETDEPEKLEFKGVVQSIGGSTWVVAGRTLVVTGATEIRDDPGVGDSVKVVAFSQPDGSWWAERIELDD